VSFRAKRGIPPWSWVFESPRPRARFLALLGMTPRHSRVAHTSRRSLSGCMRPNCAYSQRRRMLVRLTLPPSVHHHAHVRVWQRKPYDKNIWTTKKAEEKLNYLPNNPAKRGSVTEPDCWTWSSWSCYFLQDASLLAMGRVPSEADEGPCCTRGAYIPTKNVGTYAPPA